MHLPMMKVSGAAMETLDFFGGLNHNLRLGRGEFYDMQNLTSDLYPVLSPRKQRTLWMEQGNIQGLIDRDGLVYVDGPDLFLNGKRLNLQLSTLPQDCPKQLISMGAYVIILPDKKYVSTVDPGDFGSIDLTRTCQSPVELTLCNLDGTEISPSYTGSETPSQPGDCSWWLDYDNRTLQQYSAATGLWAVLETPYVKLSCPGIGVGFHLYDGVTLLGNPELQELSGGAILYGCEKDYVMIPGLLREKKTLQEGLVIERKMPRLDYCIESGNRLWGCRYGPADNGQIVNEIYCSKLGDFKNWSCYLGISTDSYTVSLGSEGAFTGAVNFGGHPIFFKEDCMHKIFGTEPGNFSVQTLACRGVDRNCSRSLSIISEVLYYKTRDGICAYDGSLPQDISRNLGKTRYLSAAAGSADGKYYISMEKQDGNFELLVYDTVRGLWHKEDDLHARFMCRCGHALLAVDEKDRLLDLTGREGKQEEEPVHWMAESGIIGVSLPGNKYLRKLAIRMLPDPGSRVTVSVQYDSAGPFESLGTVMGMNLRSFVFPVLPRRCDHLRLRLEGVGNTRVFSVTRILKPGSLVTNEL